MKVVDRSASLLALPCLVVRRMVNRRACVRFDEAGRGTRRPARSIACLGWPYRTCWRHTQTSSLVDLREPGGELDAKTYCAGNSA